MVSFTYSRPVFMVIDDFALHPDNIVRTITMNTIDDNWMILFLMYTTNGYEIETAYKRAASLK